MIRAALFGALLLSLPTGAVAQQTHVLVVTGVAGDEEHEQKFQKWATSFIETATKKEGVPEGNIIYLSDKPEKADKRSTRQNVEKAFTDLAASAKPNDAVFVLLIGHGSFDGQQAAFNLPGPDLTATDYARLLGKLSAARVAFIDTSSSSGAFLPTVSAPGRVVVTATRTGGERNETEFPEYFIDAFRDNAADRDRNGHVSVGEAFEYARTKVAQSFQQKGIILTEHATIDEGLGPGGGAGTGGVGGSGGGSSSGTSGGTGNASSAAAASTAPGPLATSIFLAANGGTTTLNVDTSDPAMRTLVEERSAIEQQINALRQKRASMEPAQYDAQMEKLLTDLALKTKAIRDLQAKKD
jgi:hypothetical protein